MTSQLTIYCIICFFVFSQKVLIAETRLNAVLGDINKALSIKATLQKLKLF